MERARRSCGRPPRIWRAPACSPLSQAMGARPAIMAACLSESEPISARPTIRATAVVVPIPGIEVRTASRRARLGSAAMRRSISASRLASEVSTARIWRLISAIATGTEASPSWLRSAVRAGDGRVPAAQHVPQGLPECAGRGGRAWLHALAADGQPPSVDAVGLGQGAGGLGEQARAQRIDDSDSEALRNEAAMGGAVELSGRLHNHKRHLMAFKGTLQAPEAGSVVGDGELRPERVEVDVESSFTDVDTDVDLGCASFGQNLALHAGLAPHHLFRTSAKGGRIHLIRGSQEPREPRSRPARPAGGGRPPRVSPHLNPIRAAITMQGRGRGGDCAGPGQVELSRKVLDSGAMAALTYDKKSIRGALDG